MRMFAAAIAGAALAVGLAMSPAQAAPGGLTPLKSVTTQESLIQKTHGWHSYCSTNRRGLRIATSAVAPCRAVVMRGHATGAAAVTATGTTAVFASACGARH